MTIQGQSATNGGKAGVNGGEDGDHDGPPSQDRLQGLIALYEENGRNWKFFLEYRHKFVVRFFIFVGAMLVVSQWSWTNLEIRAWSCAPLAFGALGSYAFFLLDKRHAVILVGCQSMGKELERRIILSQSKAAVPRDPWWRILLEPLLPRNGARIWKGFDQPRKRLPGFYNAIGFSFRWTVTDSSVLHITYLGCAVLFVIAAVVAWMNAT